MLFYPNDFQCKTNDKYQTRFYVESAWTAGSTAQLTKLFLYLLIFQFMFVIGYRCNFNNLTCNVYKP